MKKMRRFFILLFVVAMIVAVMPMTALAKGKKKAKGPYRDVTTKTVDAKSYEGICHVKAEGGWRGIAKNGKLYPNKIVTRREFVMVLKICGDTVARIKSTSC